MAYVYRHIRLDKNIPFYIGVGSDNKGSYNRAFEKRGRNIIWERISNKTKYTVEILFDDISIEEAFDKEKEFIYLYGRLNNNTGILSNLTDGGDGVAGIVYTETIINNMRKGNKRSRSVAQYQLSGEFINSFISCKEAERETGIANTAICSCANNRNGVYTASGFIWRWYFGDKSNIFFDKEEYQIMRFKKRKVNVYDKNGLFMCQYESLNEASVKMGIHKNNIFDVLKKIHIATNGYIFNYDKGDTSNINVNGLYMDRKGEKSTMFGRVGPLAGNYGNRGAKNPISKAVQQICKETGKVIRMYGNAKEAADILKIDGSGISKCCRGVIKKCVGYIWKYAS